MPNVSQIPLNKVPFLDTRNKDLVSPQWYRFLNNLFQLTGSGSSATSLGDIQVAPAPVYVDEAARLQSQLDGLGVSPAFTPHSSFSRYGVFYDTTTQTAAVINTAYPITFDTTYLSLGVTRGTTTSRIYVDRPGTYLISAILDWERTGGADPVVRAWLRVNGTTDISNSAQQSRLNTGGPYSSPFEGVLNLAAGDYFEIVWATGSTSNQLAPVAASAPYPAVPSVRLTVSNLTG